MMLCEKEIRRRLKAALQDLLKNGPSANAHGICHNVCLKGNFSYNERIVVREILKASWSKWGKFSGNVDYPIASSLQISPVAEYNILSAAGQLWEGEMKELRNELIEWLLENIESPIDESFEDEM